MCFRQCDGFRDRAATYRLGSVEDGKGSLAILNDNFRASTHVGQERRYVGSGGFFFRDVDHVLSHALIIHC